MAFKLKLAAVPVEVTRRYVMDEVCDADHPDDPIVLIVKPALESNRPYANARFKAMNAAKAKPISLDSVQAGRAETIERYARFIVVGWENVYEDGKPLACSPDAVARFLTQLVESPPDRADLAGRPDLLEALVGYCNDVDNFNEPIIGAVALGKK